MTLFENVQLITPYFRGLFALHEVPEPPQHALLVLQTDTRRTAPQLPGSITRDERHSHQLRELKTAETKFRKPRSESKNRNRQGNPVSSDILNTFVHFFSSWDEVSKCGPFSHSVKGAFGPVLAVTFGDTYRLSKREKNIVVPKIFIPQPEH